MSKKSVMGENRDISLAIGLIKLGARLQVLESETNLSYERLLKLYKEVSGKSPSKGMLPFSTDWFMSWQPNMHSSLFMNIYENLSKGCEIDEIDAIIKAYELYVEQIKSLGMEPIVSITRAWRLVKFTDAGMLTLSTCKKCNGAFVNHAFEIDDEYVCGLCAPPPRAGKASRKKESADVDA
jgi:flagellar transcriptional activator FlhC